MIIKIKMSFSICKLKYNSIFATQTLPLGNL